MMARHDLRGAGSFSSSNRSVSSLSTSSCGCNCVAISVSSQIFLHVFLCRPDRAQQRQLGKIVRKETCDVVFVGGSHVLLRLYDFQIVSDTVQEPVAGLVQRALGKLAVLCRHRHGAIGGFEVGESVPNLVVHTAHQILVLCLSAIGLRGGLLNVGTDSSAGK